MKSAVFKSIYDEVYFELVTDIVFLTKELSTLIKSYVEEMDLKISAINMKILSLEKVLEKISEKEQHKFSTDIDELNVKKKTLISKIKKDAEIQIEYIQSWIINLEHLTENKSLKKLRSGGCYTNNKYNELIYFYFLGKM